MWWGVETETKEDDDLKFVLLCALKTTTRKGGNSLINILSTMWKLRCFWPLRFVGSYSDILSSLH